MDEGNRQSTNSSQPTTDPRLAHQKVLQPSESFIQEVRASASANDTKAVGVTVYPQTVQPAQPELTNTEPKPITGGQIPVGMSASQMGFNQSRHDTNWKSVLKPILAAVVVLAVLGAGFLLYKNLTGYGSRTVQGDGFTYTITYSKMASEVSINGKSYLQGSDQSGQTMLMYVAKSTRTIHDCHVVAGGTISVIATPTIEGQQHNLCCAKSVNSCEVNFTHNGVWYYLVIKPKDESQTLNQDTVKMIASSVRISQ